MQENRTGTVASGRNIDALFDSIHGLIGKRCWKVAFSYGGELCLHFGRRMRCEHPKLAGELEGEWIFCTRGTPWELITRKQLVTSNADDERRLEKKVKVLENSRVSHFALSYPGNAFSLEFSNNCLFRVTPKAGDKRFELPDWELFMPKKMLVAFGPGNRWSRKRADLPAR